VLRPTLLVLTLLLCISTVRGQTTTTESQSLQALLAEVHRLRQDLQTAALDARRAQILIYRLYVQEAAVERATQRLDEAKSGLDQLQAQKKYQAAQIKSYEDMKDNAEDANQRKRLDDSISYLRTQIEELVPIEQETQTKKIHLEEQWRIEQAKLEQLQDELDRLDKSVMNAAIRQDSHQPSSCKLQ
jgi:hypothetical protein